MCKINVNEIDENFEEDIIELPIFIERICIFCGALSYNKIRVCCMPGFNEDKEESK